MRELESELADARSGDSPWLDVQQVVDALPVAVVIADASGSPVVSNAEGDRLLEPRIDSALVGRSLKAALAEAVEGTPVRRVEELIGPPLERHVVVASPIEGGGAIAVVQDDSDIARTEAVRRDFVANISHELKTPIGAVVLLAELLADESDGATVRRFAGRIEAEVARLGRSVDDLLELTQIEFGRPDVAEAVAVDDVLDGVIERIASVAADRCVSVARPAARSGRVVLGDPRQLGSALFNLVENAVKYSPDGASVCLGIAESGPDEVVVTVADSGIGIPGADLDRIFERFYRVDRARGRDTGGSGLGLAIVRHVVHNHGGTVEVTSTEGVGTTFTVHLPSAGADENTAER
ncbi:MAG: ATP-binding protein [Microthrixaceae bacterium]